MSIHDDVAAQLADELGVRAHDWGGIVGVDMGVELGGRAEQACPRLAAELCSPDDGIAEATVVTLMPVLFGAHDPPHEWWATPLGGVVARVVGREDSQAVTQTVAAAMLGVTRGTVSRLLGRGKLARHPDGGITRMSVLARRAGQLEP